MLQVSNNVHGRDQIGTLATMFKRFSPNEQNCNTVVLTYLEIRVKSQHSKS